MKKFLLFFAFITLSITFSVNVKAQGKAPWMLTKHWISASDNKNDYYYDAWIFGKKAKGRFAEEPKAICNGGITMMYKDNVFAYILLNYAGKNAKGYIYNATYKSKEGSPVTGKLLIRVKGNMETGPSISIKAISESLEGCDADGLELIGTPTAMDE